MKKLILAAMVMSVSGGVMATVTQIGDQSRGATGTQELLEVVNSLPTCAFDLKVVEGTSAQDFDTVWTIENAGNSGFSVEATNVQVDNYGDATVFLSHTDGSQNLATSEDVAKDGDIKEVKFIVTEGTTPLAAISPSIDVSARATLEFTCD